jgi:hypothetical protein
MDTNLDVYSGLDDGFGEMGGNAISIPLLLIRQPTSQANFDDEKVKQGDFYNSSTLKGYGSKVRVIPCYFGVLYYEWQPNMGGLAGRYTQAEFNKLVADGIVTGDAFGGYYRVFTEAGAPVEVANRNRLTETWCYMVMLADHLDDGFMMYNSTVGNIKYLKQWNSSMRLKKLPNGSKAPLFSGIWNIQTVKDKNDKGISYHFGADNMSAITFDSIVPPAMFLEHVKPVVELSASAIKRADTKALIEIESKEERKVTDEPDF